MKLLLTAIVVLAEIDAGRLAGDGVDRARDLVLALLILAFVGLSVRRWRQVLPSLGVPLLGLLVLFGAGLVLAPWSVSPFGSFLSSGSAAALVVGIAGSVQLTGARRTLEAVLAGLVVLMIASIAWELTGLGEPAVSSTGEADIGLAGIPRRIGLMGSPNEFGRAATLCFVIGAVVARSYRTSNLTRWAQILGVAGAVVAQSRTALGVLVVVSMLMAVTKGKHRNVLVAVWATAVACLTAWTFSLVGVEFFTRPGAGTEELATGTGRTRLWSYVIELIPERPIIGHGAFAAQDVLLPAVERNWIWDAADAHNLLLNVLLTQGLVGLLALLSIPVSLLVPSVQARLRSSGVGWILLSLVGLSVTENIIRKPSIGVIAGAVALAIVATPMVRTPVTHRNRLRSTASA